MSSLLTAVAKADNFHDDLTSPKSFFIPLRLFPKDIPIGYIPEPIADWLIERWPKEPLGEDMFYALEDGMYFEKEVLDAGRDVLSERMAKLVRYWKDQGMFKEQLDGEFSFA